MPTRELSSSAVSVSLACSVPLPLGAQLPATDPHRTFAVTVSGTAEVRARFWLDLPTEEVKFRIAGAEFVVARPKAGLSVRADPELTLDGVTFDVGAVASAIFEAARTNVGLATTIWGALGNSNGQKPLVDACLALVTAQHSTLVGALDAWSRVVQEFPGPSWGNDPVANAAEDRARDLISGALDGLHGPLDASYGVAKVAARAALEASFRPAFPGPFAPIRAELARLADLYVDTVRQDCFEAAVVIKLLVAAALAPEGASEALRRACDEVLDALFGAIRRSEALRDWALGPGGPLLTLLRTAKGLPLLGPDAVLAGLTRLVLDFRAQWSTYGPAIVAFLGSAPVRSHLLPAGPASRASFVSDLLGHVLDHHDVRARLATIA